MNRASSIAFLLALAWAVPATMADDVRYFEENGIQYKETTQVTQRLIPETRYETRETTDYKPRLTTEMQETVRTYQVPVTEQQWVPGYQRTWNLLAPPVLSYRLMPVTRWETRTETVRIPVTKREYVPERRVQHVPITDTKLAEDRVVRREAIGPASRQGGTSVARSESFGSTGLENDPPRESSFSGSTVDRRR